MNWTALLNEIFHLCLIPLLGVLTTYLILVIKNKVEETKAKSQNEFVWQCLDILETTVVNAVTATNQTYVDALKEKNAFDLEAQKEAFNKTYQAVMASLTEDTKKGLESITKDLSAYVSELIEAKVREQKKEG